MITPSNPICAEYVMADTVPEHMERAWDDLADHASEPNVFAERWFMQAAFSHLAGDQNIPIIAVWDSDQLLGVLPIETARGYARMPVRYVRNWQHYHSFLGTPLVRCGRERDFWTAALGLLDQFGGTSAFVHITGLVENGSVHQGLLAARCCATVHRSERALLSSPLDPAQYYEATIRKKKRKEITRLSARLAELGEVHFSTLEKADDIPRWCREFLALEQSGWKGDAGSALGCAPETSQFFQNIVDASFAKGKLNFLKLSLDNRPIAMLINFLTPPGSFSFKIAFDEAYARFSPGVLIQIENLGILNHPTIMWMDSCAVENHPMINSLWAQRRPVIRVTIPLSGIKRRAIFTLCRAAERLSAAIRARLERPAKKGTML